MMKSFENYSKLRGLILQEQEDYQKQKKEKVKQEEKKELRPHQEYLLREELGERVCVRIRKIVGEERMDNPKFVLMLLRNKKILRTGRELKTKYRDGARDSIDRAEARIDNLIRAELDAYQEKIFTKRLEYVVKTAVGDDNYVSTGIIRYMLNLLSMG